MNQYKFLLFFVYLILGLYFINSVLFFYELPEMVLVIDKWIRLVGGALIILGGINYLRASKNIKKHRD